jgi:hypothetical protein
MRKPSGRGATARRRRATAVARSARVTARKARPPLAAGKPGTAKPPKAAPRANGHPRKGDARRVAKTAVAEHRVERVLHGGRPAKVDAAVTSRGKYVYCVIEAQEPLRFGPIGIGADPSDVYTVHFKNLAAVVSDAPLEVLDSTRENVLAHERVNETVMREHTVIPMSFGTIFKTREDIVELLRSAAEAFGDVLNKMQNKL